MNEQRFVARPGFIVREIAGEYLLVAVNDAPIYIREDDSVEKELRDYNGMVQLDETGLFLWNQLSQPQTISELVSKINEEYETNGYDVTRDVMEFLDTGIRNQLIFILADL